jgi:hypothetical protein
MTDPALKPAVEKHMSIFMPYALERIRQLGKAKTRFVHYTSADVGLKIIAGRTVWMRQAACMNDYSEIEHGLQCLHKAWHSEHGKRLQAFLDAKFPEIVKEITTSFDAFQNSLRFDTYVTSLSEHAPVEEYVDEDKYGRLSMWRAYGRDVGIALVIRPEPFWSADTSLGLFTTPVAYLDEEAFTQQFKTVVDNIEANGAYLDEIGKDWVRHSMVMIMSAAAVSTKHPGFKEEREWRVVRTPNFPFPCPLEKMTATVNGVPQHILLIPLKNNPPSLVGIEPAELLDRVIIGPTAYPMAVYNAYVAGLKEVGVVDASSKVKISFLPLRTGER